MNLRVIIRLIGILLVVEGLAMLLAMVVSFFYNDHDTSTLAWSSLSCFLPGLALVLTLRKSEFKLKKRDTYFAILLIWIVFPAFGTLPFLIGGTFPGFTDAFFESVSGFTTTGASVVTDPQTLPHGLLFWRSLLQWMGGISFIVLVLIAVPFSGSGGMALFLTEIPRTTSERPVFKFGRAIVILFLIYAALTLAETIFLMIGGMNLFDAVCHSFSTLSTGGFSTRQDNIGHWESPLIRYTVVFFMILGGTNFTLFYLSIRGKFTKAWHDEEFRYYLLAIIIFTILLTAGLVITGKSGLYESFREGLFHTVSIITTTGFVTGGFGAWPPVLIILVITLFFIGGCTGSSASGIKIPRVLLLMKNGYYELLRLVHPHAVVPVKLNKQTVDIKVLNNILAYLLIYLSVVFFCTLLFSFTGSDLNSPFGAVASCLGNIGPGLGKMSSPENYSLIHPLGKWLLSALMIAGRLELTIVIVIFSGTFWKK